MQTAPARVVALGASNLTRGFPHLVAAARSWSGPDVEVLAALGLGRSYGVESRVLARTLPGILDCGLWSALARRPEVSTRALVTDVGNDILYGAPPERILDWVEDALGRLRRVTADIVVAGLPLDSIRRLSAAKFLAFRTILYPPCRLPLTRVRHDAERIAEGLAGLAASHGAHFVALRPDWYGFDPVHVRPARWAESWQTILRGEPTPDGARPSLSEMIRLHAMTPERQRLFGIERTKAGHGLRLPYGGRVWLY